MIRQLSMRARSKRRDPARNRIAARPTVEAFEQRLLLSLTTIDVPGASGTVASGINSAGQVVGYYLDDYVYVHGFLESGGSFTTIDVPGASSTVATGINSAGQVVGYYLDLDDSGFHGFLESAGSFTTIDVPGANETLPGGINDAGQVVGDYLDLDDSGFHGHGFLESGGSFTTIDVPGASSTGASGINSAGQVVGGYEASGEPQDFHGFLESAGSFTTIDVPGASSTVASGINSAGQVVGDYSAAPAQDNASGDHGFLESAGSFTTIDVPGAYGTVAYGINSADQVVGYYLDASGDHGFLLVLQAAPSFSGLSAPTIIYGTATTTVSGHLDANADGQLIPAGETVQVSVNGVNQDATLNSNDDFSTSFDTSTLTVAGSPYTIGFSYAGDANFTSASASSTLTVNQAVTTTSLTSSVNPSLFGQSVTFTAMVTANAPGSGTPTGSVTFMDGTTALNPGGTMLDDSGTATFTTTTLAAGDHPAITAVYGGDTNFSGSTSAAIDQFVGPDLAATSLTWASDGGVDYGYSISGADLPQATTVDLDWASGTTADAVIGSPIISTTTATAQGTYQLHATPSQLGTPPPGATYLLVVADPGNLVSPADPSKVASLALSSIVVDSVKTCDSREVIVSYEITTQDLDQSFEIGIYRSDQPEYDANDAKDVEVASYQVAGDYLNEGAQTITIDSSNGNWGMNANALSDPLVPDPQLPYVLAVADPEDQLPANVTTDSTLAHFQIYTIAAVTHGQEFSNDGPASAPWVGCIVAGLQAEGYNKVLPVYWNSWPPGAGQTQAAGANMYNQIVAAASSLSGFLQPNDIIDVQLIGHSRGASVIGVAMQDLVTNSQSIPQLQHGYYEMTFLDPHPANAGTTGDVSLASLAALSLVWTPAEYVAVVVDLGYILASASANDQSVTVPSRVNQVQDYYQRNSNFALSGASVLNSPWEAAFNLWGDPRQITIADPSTTLAYAVNISSLGVGHGEVPLWYLTNLAVLTNGSPPPNPLPPWPADDPPGDAPPPDSDPDPDQLLVIPASLEGASGAGTEVYVVAVTSAGNPDTSFNGSVTLALQNPNGATLGGTLTENAVDGVAEFTDASVDRPGDGYVLQASSSGADSGSSPAFDDFTDQLAITTGPPSSVSVGSSYPIVVEAQDGAGNVDASFNGQVTVTVADPFDDSQGTTVTLNAVDGMAHGTVTFTQPGEFILTATSDGVAEAFSPIGVIPVSSLPTPSFSNLSAPVVTYGTASTTISGQLQVNAGQQTITAGETVQVTLNGVVQNATLASDDSFSTSFATGTLGVAGSPYTIGFSYAGNANFTSASASSTLTVNQAGTTTALVGGPSPSVYGQSVTFTATVSPVAPGGGTPTGSVEFFDGTTALDTETLDNTGTASFTSSALAVGSHSITVQYLGDGNFTGNSSSAFSQTVNQAGTTTGLSASPTSTNAGQPVTLTATIAVIAPGAGTPTGSVQFFVGVTSLGSASLSGNTAILTTTTLPIGADSLTAQYLGDSNFTESTSSAVSVTTNPSGIATTTTLTSSTNPSLFGQSVTFTAAVTSSSGSGTPTGSVTFYDGSTALGTVTLSSKKATLKTTSVPVGSQGITAVYSGATTYAPSTSAVLTQTVNQDLTTTKVTSSANPSVYGQSVTLTATVKPASPGSGTPTGTVTFYDGTTNLGSGTLSGGTATLPTTFFIVGSHSIKADYSGDPEFTASTSSTLTQTVKQAVSATAVVSLVDPSVYGQQLTFTTTVSANTPGSGTPTGTVTFSVGSTVLGTATLGGGTARLSVSPQLSVGNHTIKASYGGGTNFKASAGTVTQTVNQDSTTTSVVSSANPSVYGQSVTFTAAVTANAPGSGTPTGSLTFMSGMTTLGTVTLSGGKASYSTAKLATGVDTITATYNGSSSFITSSASLNQAVNQDATSATVTSSLNPSIHGQSVTFTAIVSAASPGSGTPTGTVTFMDGSTTLNTSTLNASGKATFKTSSLPAGSQAITGVYGGNTNFVTSTSAVLTQTVNQDSTTTKVSSSADPSVYGQSVTFTATVTAASPGSGTPTGSVEFYDGSTELGSGTLNGTSTATFTASTLSIGTHSITGIYSGDGNFTTSTSSAVSQRVNQASTTTTLASSANLSASGQAVTFTATISVSSPGSGTPTGTVTFYDGSKSLGTGSVSGAIGTFTTSSLSVGSHSIKAVYGGDTNFKTSTSAALTQVVNSSALAVLIAGSTNPVDHALAALGDEEPSAAILESLAMEQVSSRIRGPQRGMQG
jgi:hypothetical protein